MAVRVLREKGLPDEAIVAVIRKVLRERDVARRDHPAPPAHRPDR
jgi:hypothetical protein